MLMVTAACRAFIEPVVILRGRKLSFKQLANGTVVIGGGHLGDALSRREPHRARLGASSRQRPHGVGAVPGRCARPPSCAPGPASRRACPTTSPSSARARTSEGVFHQFGFSAHGFQLGPGAGAVMAELIATGATNLPIEPFSIARFSASG